MDVTKLIHSLLTSIRLSDDTWLPNTRFEHLRSLNSTINIININVFFNNQGPYRRWCKSNGFLSMLPEDAKARRKEALEKLIEQTQVNDHFHPMMPDDKPTPYSDEAFKEAAIQWLIETDQVRLNFLLVAFSHGFLGQPIAAFEHPSFQKMINIASRANHGVKILNQH
jgi:hypothetical protein